jgi:glycosyltransferase involved in cell wall biosynthesis
VTSHPCHPAGPGRVAATVAICTYNGAARVPAVIDALAAQTAPAEAWELIVVDNASTDGTGTVADGRIREKLRSQGRVVREARQGLSFARARAAVEAAGEILCFLDDDNIPAPTWVASALDAFLRRPRAGVIGGKVHPRWESPPTPLAEAVAPFALAVCDQGDAPVQIEAAGGGIVGAGLCVRTNLLREIYGDPEFSARVTGRSGGSLMSGEDLAISVQARERGWECWYEPALVIAHRIPASRMDPAYLLQLYEGIGRGQAATRLIYDWKARNAVLGMLIGLKDLGRWLKGELAAPTAEDGESELGRQLNRLHQRQLWGRGCQALSSRRIT